MTALIPISLVTCVVHGIETPSFETHTISTTTPSSCVREREKERNEGEREKRYSERKKTTKAVDVSGKRAERISVV